MAFDSFDLTLFEQSDGTEREALAADLDRICRETGFLLLRNHGVSVQTVEAIIQAAQRFFDLPMADKQAVAPPEAGSPYGYLAPETEALAASKGVETPPDLKESFNGGPLTVPRGLRDEQALGFCFAPTPWPDLPGFREAWVAYYAEMERLAERVMVAFAAALGLDDDFFAPYIDAPVSALRALNYPATEGQPQAGQQRAGAHSDYGSLTILLPQPGSRGLQIQSPSGGWIDAPAEPGCFVINIGDLMARWTADRWVSTLHRVIAAPNQPRRQSLAFFHQPNWDAEIKPLGGSDAYGPVLSGPYLMSKFQSTGQS